MTPIDHPVLSAIRARIARDQLLVDPDVTEAFRRDQAAWAAAGRPLAVVRARSTEDVRVVVSACHEHGVPVVARGAGSGLSGGANAIDGGIVLVLDAMADVREVNALERYAVVGPGVVNDDLRAAVAEHGLWYPPDPASAAWSTIGGNVATNAGGLCCVKYGVTRDHVLELEVVTGTGEVVRLGRRTAKGVVGYDLVGLMVGSEGTLGIVTEVVVRLRPLPPAPITVAGHFDSVVDAGAAAAELAARGIVPSALELIDRHCLLAVDRWKNMGLAVEANAVLLARIDDPVEIAGQIADLVVGCFTAAGATWADRSTDPAEAEALFAARRLAYPALERLGPVITEDVCVPRATVPAALAGIEEIARRHDVTIANIAHIGDGNLHPLIITSTDDDALVTRARSAFEEILDLAIGLGGTVTGEHGVGQLKLEGLRRELSPAALEMHRAVKRALDPRGILNPGRAIG